MFSLKFHYYYNLVFFCTEKSIYDRIDWKTSANENSQVKLYPMLLTFHGLPGSKKPTAFSKLAPHTNDENLPGFSHNEFVVSGFGPGNKMRYTNTAFDDEFVQSLKSGVGLMNVWDIGMNTIIVPFLHQFSGHFSLNYTWLFIDLDRDLPSLHLPLEVGDEPITRCQSRVENLFHSCHLSRGSTKKFVCTIFATHKYEFEDVNFTTQLNKLKDECNNVAKQMGLQELVDTQLIPIKMESDEAVRLLERTMQKVFRQLHSVYIPESWMSLRCSFAQYQSTYITDQELENKALNYGIFPDSLNKFCKLFTSFGSILDVRLIDVRSKYIIIKPNEFLHKLLVFFNQMKEKSDLAYNGIMEQSRCKNQDAFLEILYSVGLVAKVPNNSIFNGMDIPGPAFYISAVRVGAEKMASTHGAIQLIIGMESTPVNLHIMITDYLLNHMENVQLRLTSSINVTTARINKGPFEIELKSLGDVIEIVSHGSEKYGPMYRNLCRRIVKACHNVAQTMASQSRNIKYHFAITCKHREIRHVLPSDLCKECNDSCINKGQVHVWNDILTNVSK